MSSPRPLGWRRTGRDRAARWSRTDRGSCPGTETTSRRASTRCRGRPERALARDVRFFRELVPDGLPGGHGQPELLAEVLHFRGKRLADLVVVTQLELELPIDLILRRSWPSEDVHRADVPLVERRLGFRVSLAVLGELLHPVLTVADMELLLLEDAVDRPYPWPVGAAAHVLELVAGAPVHAEVEEDEIGPRVDRVIEDVHPLVARDARGADVAAGVDAHCERLVVLAHVAVDVDAEIGQQAVHDGRVAELVLHDLGDYVLFLDRRGLGDPRQDRKSV